MKAIRHEDGGAMVEFAVSMIAVVPIFLGALFIDDLLRFRLDLQEAVASSAWDFTAQDYTPDGAAASTLAMNVEQQNREPWCMHREGPGCPDVGSGTRTGVGGAVGWDDEITCDLDTSQGHPGSLLEIVRGNPIGLLSGNFYDSVNRGGLGRCRGSFNVVNFIMPEVFLPDHAAEHEGERGGLGREQYDREEGASAADGGSRGAYGLQESSFSVLVDTWAILDSETYDPDDRSGGPLYDRVSMLYGNDLFYLNFGSMYLLFLIQVARVDWLAALMWQEQWDQIVDWSLNPSPNIAKSTWGGGRPTNSVPRENTSLDFHTFPTIDWRGDLYEQTRSERTSGYMGQVDD